MLPDAPFAVPAATTVAVTGPGPLPAAFSRAVAVARLRGAGSAAGATLLSSTAGASADLVVELGVDGSGRVVHASGPAAGCEPRTFQPVFLTADAHAAAVDRGGELALDQLLARPATGGLAARFLIGPDGPLDLDLVADGPHAVVGGTTGSGKSALLTAWVLALAAAHPPERLVLLLVDCKGGAAFDPLASLPQVAGVVTDLDTEEVERAVASLAAELRRREQAVRDAGGRDITATGLPRLVVVVDEYRALVERAPDLAALFGDLAARGRSLGVHLVLCTQRPAGSVRDEVLANCSIRISLRVQDAADSRAVVGTDAAALLGRDSVGGAILLTDRPLRVRVAGVAGRRGSGGGGGPGRATVRSRRGAAVAAEPPDRGFPSTRCATPPVPLDRARAHRSAGGAAAAGAGLGPGPAAAAAPRRRPWQRPEHRARRGRARARRPAAAAGSRGALGPDRAAGSPLLVDDLDHLLDRLGDAHRTAAVERLAVRLRDPAAAPTVVTVRGPSAWAGLPLRAVVGLFDETILLALGLDDHLALGGVRSGWTGRAVPGRGWCGGARVQLALTPVAEPEPRPRRRRRRRTVRSCS